MTFTAEERRLLHIYYAGSIRDTAHVVRCALKYIYEPDVRAVAEGLLWKLGGMEGAELDSCFDMGDLHG